MKLQNSLNRLAVTGLAALSAAIVSTGALAATGGGATIHNAATLTYNSGQQVTDWVNVDVLTIGTDPSFALTSPGPFVANAGETITLSYTITANANGSDTYSLSAATSSTADLAAGTTFVPSVNTVTLGATVTSAPSEIVDGDTGTIFVPAGSETNLDVGDTVVINGFTYTIEAIRAGSVASTLLNTTTGEVWTEIDLTVPNGSGSPSVGNANIATGEQVGEQQSFTVAVTVTAPLEVGTDGTVDVVLTGNTSALDTSGNPAGFDTSTDGSGTNDPTITVLSATVSIVKEARNVTKNVLVFNESGVNAQSGDVLEYRITMEAAEGSGDAVDSVLRDEIPEYTTYVANSTKLNGVDVTDAGGANAFPLADINGGLGVNSVNGTADQVGGGVLKDGDTTANGDAAVIIFRVTVD